MVRIPVPHPDEYCREGQCPRAGDNLPVQRTGTEIDPDEKVGYPRPSPDNPPPSTGRTPHAYGIVLQKRLTHDERHGRISRPPAGGLTIWLREVHHLTGPGLFESLPTLPERELLSLGVQTGASTSDDTLKEPQPTEASQAGL